VLPLGVLAWWAAEGASAGAPFRLAWQAAVDSTLASGVAAGCAGLAAIPVALLAWRHPSRRTRLLERLAYLPNAVPGIAVALALVFFGARYGGVLYQSLAMLIFAYVVRFLPQALASALLLIAVSAPLVYALSARRAWELGAPG
jgi:iron(III) transport system permease protein